MAAISTTAGAPFERLSLPDPQNWLAGDRLFPSNVIASFNGEYDKYNKESWAEYVLAQCKGFEACTSSLSYSAINSGTPEERAWFGFAFRGGKTTVDDYKRADGVEDAVVYTKEA
ncbi:hypothetical protein QQS21_000590 [Conoideocrella luteorostrata]|uniref:Uncharacterized protein n=1 Tax=Conoideocrella luteorostrata TaxID=1105319 RepID=A0AAJ0CYT8_9HYPO|nr:hypothetical protein QQS21_000590 [Conoideocrella luteorostrata]